MLALKTILLFPSKRGNCSYFLLKQGTTGWFSANTGSGTMLLVAMFLVEAVDELVAELFGFPGSLAARRHKLRPRGGRVETFRREVEQGRRHQYDGDPGRPQRGGRGSGAIRHSD